MTKKFFEYKKTLHIAWSVFIALLSFWELIYSVYDTIFDKYETYIKDCKACEDTQRKLQLALLSYSGPNTSIGNVRDETDFLRVERLLIDWLFRYVSFLFVHMWPLILSLSPFSKKSSSFSLTFIEYLYMLLIFI